VEMPTKDNITMATQETDSKLFIPVTRSKASKKACLTYQQGQHAKLEVNRELSIIFELLQQPCTMFNPVTSTKNLLME